MRQVHMRMVRQVLLSPALQQWCIMTFSSMKKCLRRRQFSPSMFMELLDLCPCSSQLTAEMRIEVMMELLPPTFPLFSFDEDDFSMICDESDPEHYILFDPKHVRFGLDKSAVLLFAAAVHHSLLSSTAPLQQPGRSPFGTA